MNQYSNQHSTMKQTLVYPWIANMSRGNELKFSLRSVEKNFSGPVEVWIVGDKPNWYCGNCLPIPPYDSKLILPRQDRAKKLWRVVEEPSIDNEFLWMMDDIYFLRTVDLDLFRIPWFRGALSPDQIEQKRPKTEWERQKLLTWQTLKDNGRPLFDFGTHLPQIYQKDNLRILFEKYGLRDAPYVDDILYGNEFLSERLVEELLKTDSQDSLNRIKTTGNVNRIQYRETGRPTLSGLQKRAARKQSRVFNHVDKSYTPTVEQFLMEKFPNPSRWEK